MKSQSLMESISLFFSIERFPVNKTIEFLAAYCQVQIEPRYLLNYTVRLQIMMAYCWV